MLHLPHFQVRLGQVGLQRWISGCLSCQAVQVLQRFLYDELPSWRGSREVLHCGVQFEEQRIRQVPHVLEATFRSGSFGTGHFSLMRRHSDPKHERSCYRRRGRDTHPVPADELRAAVPQCRRPSGRRTSFARGP